MGDSDYTWFGVLTRMLLALILVLVTYNPEGYSYYHWGILQLESDMPAKVLIGFGLLIAWAMYIRSAGDSMGYMGTFLTMSFFGTLVWMVVNNGWLPIISEKIMIYVVLVVVSWIVATDFSLTLPSRHKSTKMTAP